MDWISMERRSLTLGLIKITGADCEKEENKKRKPEKEK